MKDELSSVSDFRSVAKQKLTNELFTYIEKTAGEGKTFNANLTAFDPYKLVPRVLSGLTSVNLETTVLSDSKISAPLMIGPTAFHGLFHADGEMATSLAAKSFGTKYIASCFSTRNFLEMSDISNTWYQMLMYRNIDLMKAYINKAEVAGCSALVLTVDAPLGCSMCKSLPGEKKVDFPIHSLPLFPVDPEIPYSTLDEYYSKYMNSAFSWEDVRSIVDFTKLPVILKGILHPMDVARSIAVGAKGIVISNHGGRQQDGVLASLDALAQVPSDLKSKIDIYFDSGIRTGVDIFKALALGAKAVLLGRPVLYGLAVDGKSGVFSVLSILKKELEECMRLTGCNSLAHISPELLTK